LIIDSGQLTVIKSFAFVILNKVKNLFISQIDSSLGLEVSGSAEPMANVG